LAYNQDTRLPPTKEHVVVIDIIDLNFQGQPAIIASYVLRGPRGVALVETGPASTYPALKAGLAALGIELAQVTDILVTHIHLDHSGAAGRLAQETGATVHVHAVGAPHLADPGKLLASARRIYGDAMDSLWGETRPAPAGQVHALAGGDEVDAAGLRITAVETPGHAWHHMAYLLDGLCWTGDVAAVRFPSLPHVRVPTPPPEIDLAAWGRSLARLRELRPDRLFPTHFGPVAGDVTAHLQTVEQQLAMAADFVRQRWKAGQSVETIVDAYKPWIAAGALADGADAAAAARFEVIVPSEMCVQGLARYFQKQAG
jgi:glyoxylase-like metal-dependent hydrolase (beta-lactamase superfamily II)